MFRTLRQIRRVVIAVIGFTLLLVGISMIVLPGPALIIIPLALAILATEFAWARKILTKIRNRIKKPGDRLLSKRPPGSC